MRPIGCPRKTRINVDDQLSLYIKFLKTSGLTHIHVYPATNNQRRITQDRLRSEGYKLLEV